jgi:exodeoxyribonuclease-3
MKIISWNVNSVHARLPRITALLARHQPGLVCLQEIKTSSGAFPPVNSPRPVTRPS